VGLWNAATGQSTGQAGDFDGDDDVDGNDYLVWQRGLGSQFDAADLADWRTNFGATGGATAVPEPAALGLAVIAAMAAARRLRGR
jgi:hypothetical protein